MDYLRHKIISCFKIKIVNPCLEDMIFCPELWERGGGWEGKTWEAPDDTLRSFSLGPHNGGPQPVRKSWMRHPEEGDLLAQRQRG